MGARLVPREGRGSEDFWVSRRAGRASPSLSLLLLTWAGGVGKKVWVETPELTGLGLG